MKCIYHLFFPMKKARTESSMQENIRKYRKKRGLSQNALARKSELTLLTIFKLESGATTNPSIDTAQRIAKALSITVDELIK